MRREQIQTAGGAVALKLWPETEQEQALTPIERAFLAATLTQLSASDPTVRNQIEHAACTCRHATGYGMYLELAIPSSCRASSSVKRDAGGAILVWRGSERMLQSIAFFKHGLLDFLEIIPVDGDSWAADECLAITSARIDAVDITPQAWE
jgi:hypothetical protein